MLGALIAGEQDPRVLAELTKGRMRIKIPQLAEALTGHLNADDAQLAGSMLTGWSGSRLRWPSWMW